MRKAEELLKAQLDNAHVDMERAGQRASEIQAQLASAKKAKGMDKWLGFVFESSSGLTPEFSAFSREFRAWVKKNLPHRAKLEFWGRGHFYCSGFIEREGKYVYFSISDVRFFPDDWRKNILVRIAQDVRDYTGGTNCYTDMEHFTQEVERLLEVA